MKIKKIDYLGFDHDKVKEMFQGVTRFVNYFCVKGYNGPMAVYYSESPDRSKSHKDYMMLYKPGGQYMVTGLDEKDITHNERYRSAIYCEKCDELLYSAYRHDCNSCTCGEQFMDGGDEYSRCTMGPTFRVDLLTDTIYTWDEYDKLFPKENSEKTT